MPITKAKVTKAAAKKTTAKKPVLKKATTAKKTPTKAKQPIKKVLVCADDATCFWTTDGAILKDLTDLRDTLAGMPAEVFSHHVSKEKNDFADWVEHVLCDQGCAADLRKAKKPTTARTTIVRHLRYYSL